MIRDLFEGSALDLPPLFKVKHYKKNTTTSSCAMSNQTKTSTRKIRTRSSRAENPKRRRTQEREQVFANFKCEGLFLTAENKENLETCNNGTCLVDVSEVKPFLRGKDCKKVMVTPCVEEETFKGVMRDRLAEVLGSVLQRLEDLEEALKTSNNDLTALKTSNNDLQEEVTALKTSNKELTEANKGLTEAVTQLKNRIEVLETRRKRAQENLASPVRQG
ncbi:hypothetical protein QOT17_014134 [Balamuthia mandrillaris]